MHANLQGQRAGVTWLCPHEVHIVAMDLSGVLLNGRYQLSARLGVGGMSEVYAAEDLHFGRPVAIKVVKQHTSAVDNERLFREAKATARISHPAVLTVFSDEQDSDASVEFIVLERLAGETVFERISREGPLEPGLVHRLGLVIADVLDAAHGCGVVHRDIKPHNIFIAKRGALGEEIKLMDFGIAKQLDLHTITHPNQILGTLLYLAPELLGGPHDANARSDIYALGVTLFEALTGKHPFAARHGVEALALLSSGRTPVAQELRQDAPVPLCAIIERCMRYDPNERYESAAALRHELQACASSLGALTK